jgi:uncharacterized membrane protein
MYKYSLGALLLTTYFIIKTLLELVVSRSSGFNSHAGLYVCRYGILSTIFRHVSLLRVKNPTESSTMKAAVLSVLVASAAAFAPAAKVRDYVSYDCSRER